MTNVMQLKNVIFKGHNIDMNFYKKIKTLKRKEVVEHKYGNGNTVYTINFIYNVESRLFNKTKFYEETVTDDIKFVIKSSAEEYISLVEKESSYVLVGFDSGPSGYYNQVHLKDDSCLKYYKSDKLTKKYQPYIVFYGTYQLVFDGYFQKSNKTLQGLIDSMIKDNTVDVSVVSTIALDAKEKNYIPEQSEYSKLDLNRQETIDAELKRIKQYETFLLSLK